MKKNIINIFSVIIIIILFIFFIVTAGKIVNRNSDKETPDSSDSTPVSDITASGTSSQEASDAVSEQIDSNSNNKPEAKFASAPDGYFKDALFIGDSRTVGLSEYGGINGATFFCNTGMSVYNIYKNEVDVTGLGKLTFERLMTEHSYGKIYIMLGINELGYDRSATIERYADLIKAIKGYQKDSVIFIEANLHVTAARSSTDDIINNGSIDDFNSKISELADNKTVFYIDINTEFDHPAGSLNPDYTFDDVHILGKYYADWGKWFATKAIVK